MADQPKPSYLGDSVYVRMDGPCFVLYLDNGYGEHTTIIMEPEVLESFDCYREYVKTFRPNCDCGYEFQGRGDGVIAGGTRYCWSCRENGVPYGEGRPSNVGVYIDTNIPDESL